MKKEGRKPGIQALLDEIAETSEFKQHLLAEVGTRNLDFDEVMFCFNRIYHVLSRWAHGHNNHLVIEDRFHNDNERAGLAALMQVQDQWDGCCEIGKHTSELQSPC